MAPNGASAPSDLSKLTVPQLKALCKERRITGYSKLSKAALLQKLAEIAVPTKTTTPSDGQSNRAIAASTIPHEATVRTREPARNESSSTGHEGNVLKVPNLPIRPAVACNAPIETSSAKAPPINSKSLQNNAATSTRKPSGTKRLAHIDSSAPPKRTKTSVDSGPATATSHEPPVPRAITLQQRLPVDAFKVPELPTRRNQSLYGGVSIPMEQPSGVSKSSATRQTTAGPSRFKPIVVITRPKPVKHVQASKEPQEPLTASADSPFDYSFQATPLPVLSLISFPPRASERKWVHRWAIILSSLSPKDRRTCMLVSRTFRYAVYLSATHILSRNYAGRRWDVIFEQHPRNMTNFWPYLRLRMAEASERRQMFYRTFLGRYLHSIGYNPLSEHLWTSPNDEKQVDIAIRFVLTRMWFAVSVGAYGHDASSWSRCVVRDVQEVVKGEVWQVVAQDIRNGESCNFYVLEATCEVIGQPPSSTDVATLGYRLRADWSVWISQRSQAPPDAGPRSLLDCVKWSNTEDYHQGISKAWLHRVRGQDADNIAKKRVAERYILASVVANGISGPWMSTSAMAQEFAGLPGKGGITSRTTGRSVNTVNMYLPAHHHIESVHFTTSKGEALHVTVAVVQTPGREYYVLRDNGMQVGCEEEGIPEVWRQILGCDALGRVC